MFTSSDLNYAQQQYLYYTLSQRDFTIISNGGMELANVKASKVFFQIINSFYAIYDSYTHSLKYKEVSIQIFLKGSEAWNVIQSGAKSVAKDLDTVIEISNLPFESKDALSIKDFFHHIAKDFSFNILKNVISEEIALEYKDNCFQNLCLFKDRSLFLISFAGIDLAFPIPQIYEPRSTFLHESIRIKIPVLRDKIFLDRSKIDSSYDLSVQEIYKNYLDKNIVILNPELIQHNGIERVCYLLTKGWTINDTRSVEVLFRDLEHRVKDDGVSSSIIFFRLYELITKKRLTPLFSLHLYLNLYRVLTKLHNKGVYGAANVQKLMNKAFLETSWKRVFGETVNIDMVSKYGLSSYLDCQDLISNSVGGIFQIQNSKSLLHDPVIQTIYDNNESAVEITEFLEKEEFISRLKAFPDKRYLENILKDFELLELCKYFSLEEVYSICYFFNKIRFINSFPRVEEYLKEEFSTNIKKIVKNKKIYDLCQNICSFTKQKEQYKYFLDGAIQEKEFLYELLLDYDTAVVWEDIYQFILIGKWNNEIVLSNTQVRKILHLFLHSEVGKNEDLFFHNLFFSIIEEKVLILEEFGNLNLAFLNSSQSIKALWLGYLKDEMTNLSDEFIHSKILNLLEDTEFFDNLCEVLLERGQGCFFEKKIWSLVESYGSLDQIGKALVLGYGSYISNRGMLDLLNQFLEDDRIPLFAAIAYEKFLEENDHRNTKILCSEILSNFDKEHNIDFFKVIFALPIHKKEVVLEKVLLTGFFQSIILKEKKELISLFYQKIGEENFSQKTFENILNFFISNANDKSLREFELILKLIDRLECSNVIQQELFKKFTIIFSKFFLILKEKHPSKIQALAEKTFLIMQESKIDFSSDWIKECLEAGCIRESHSMLISKIQNEKALWDLLDKLENVASVQDIEKLYEKLYSITSKNHFEVVLRYLKKGTTVGVFSKWIDVWKRGKYCELDVNQLRYAFKCMSSSQVKFKRELLNFIWDSSYCELFVPEIFGAFITYLDLPFEKSIKYFCYYSHMLSSENQIRLLRQPVFFSPNGRSALFELAKEKDNYLHDCLSVLKALKNEDLYSSLIQKNIESLFEVSVSLDSFTKVNFVKFYLEIFKQAELHQLKKVIINSKDSSLIQKVFEIFLSSEFGNVDVEELESFIDECLQRKCLVSEKNLMSLVEKTPLEPLLHLLLKNKKQLDWIFSNPLFCLRVWHKISEPKDFLLMRYIIDMKLYNFGSLFDSARKKETNQKIENFFYNCQVPVDLEEVFGLVQFLYLKTDNFKSLPKITESYIKALINCLKTQKIEVRPFLLLIDRLFSQRFIDRGEEKCLVASDVEKTEELVEDAFSSFWFEELPMVWEEDYDVFYRLPKSFFGAYLRLLLNKNFRKLSFSILNLSKNQLIQLCEMIQCQQLSSKSDCDFSCFFENITQKVIQNLKIINNRKEKINLSIHAIRFLKVQTSLVAIRNCFLIADEFLSSNLDLNLATLCDIQLIVDEIVELIYRNEENHEFAAFRKPVYDIFEKLYFYLFHAGDVKEWKKACSKRDNNFDKVEDVRKKIIKKVFSLFYTTTYEEDFRLFYIFTNYLRSCGIYNGFKQEKDYDFIINCYNFTLDILSNVPEEFTINFTEKEFKTPVLDSISTEKLDNKKLTELFSFSLILFEQLIHEKQLIYIEDLIRLAKYLKDLVRRGAFNNELMPDLKKDAQNFLLGLFLSIEIVRLNKKDNFTLNWDDLLRKVYLEFDLLQLAMPKEIKIMKHLQNTSFFESCSNFISESPQFLDDSQIFESLKAEECLAIFDFLNLKELDFSYNLSLKLKIVRICTALLIAAHKKGSESAFDQERTEALGLAIINFICDVDQFDTQSEEPIKIEGRDCVKIVKEMYLVLSNYIPQAFISFLGDYLWAYFDLNIKLRSILRHDYKEIFNKLWECLKDEKDEKVISQIMKLAEKYKISIDNYMSYKQKKITKAEEIQLGYDCIKKIEGYRKT